MDLPERAAELGQFILNFRTGMPTSFPTGELFKISLHAARLVAIREAHRYRMVEIATEAQRCLHDTQAISAAILIRAALESTAVMYYVDNAVQTAVAEDKVGAAEEVLLRVIDGGKKWQSDDAPVESVNALTMIGHLGKKYEGFIKGYDYLCEIAHPNKAGAITAYASHDEELNLSLAPPPPEAADHLYPILLAALSAFQVHYNRIADAFPAFVELCRRDAPRTYKERDEYVERIKRRSKK